MALSRHQRTEVRHFLVALLVVAGGSFYACGSSVERPVLILAASEPGNSRLQQECIPEVKLTWTATSERGVYGYLIYRSEDREGPFVRVNVTVVKAEGVSEAEIGDYFYVDRRVDVGKTYFYYLDHLSKTGAKKRFSGVVAKAIEQTPCAN